MWNRISEGPHWSRGHTEELLEAVKSGKVEGVTADQKVALAWAVEFLGIACVATGILGSQPSGLGIDLEDARLARLSLERGWLKGKHEPVKTEKKKANEKTETKKKARKKRGT